MVQCDFAEERGALEKIEEPSHGYLAKENITEVERRELR